MSFHVTKSSPSVLIGPSEPTPAGNIPLSSTDKSRLCNSLTSLQVFDNPIHEPAETVRRALSRALVHYHPIAGRLAVGANSEIHLACTGEGVVFVAATASCSLEDVRFLHAPLAIPLPDLVLRYGGRCRVSHPLLMVQVTEFSCGGYVAAVTFNHGVADVTGVAQFLGAVELARGVSPPSVLPVRYDGSLPEIPQLFTALAPRLAGRGHVDFAYTDVTIPWSYINRVKAEFIQKQGDGSQRPCSTFDVVAATMWQCRTRAITNGGVDDPGAPVPLVFVANVRSHVGAKDGYYGITSQVVTAASGTVANGDIVELVKLVSRVKERIPSMIEAGEVPAVQDEELTGALCGYGVLTLTSWAGIGLDAVDFGGGRPVRVMGNKERTVLPTCIACPPCSRKGSGGGSDGVNVIAFCVREEHVDGFHAELAMLR